MTNEKSVTKDHRTSDVHLTRRAFGLAALTALAAASMKQAPAVAASIDTYANAYSNTY